MLAGRTSRKANERIDLSGRRVPPYVAMRLGPEIGDFVKEVGVGGA